MKKKLPKDIDVVELMGKIQEQLAVLDQKLDAFMTKSLNELAQARAAATKPVVHVSPSPVGGSHRPQDRPSGRPMYAVVCYDCGKDTEIPFKPSGDRPVYCKECFAKRKSGQGPKVNSVPSINPTVSEQFSSKSVIDATSSAPKNKKTAVKKSAAPKKATPKKKAAKRK